MAAKVKMKILKALSWMAGKRSKMKENAKLRKHERNENISLELFPIELEPDDDYASNGFQLTQLLADESKQ
jgi:hypothetical protein